MGRRFHVEFLNEWHADGHMARFHLVRVGAVRIGPKGDGILRFVLAVLGLSLTLTYRAGAKA